MTTDTKPAQTVGQLLAQIAGTHEGQEPPDVDQRAAAYWWGKPDDEIVWALGVCRMIASDPVAEAIYLARVAEDGSRFRQIKDWGYRQAVEFVGSRKSEQRRRSLVESYRTDWGHQAARDGLARALWPHLVDEMPGRDARSKQYGCGHQAFMRVRDSVEQACRRAFDEFRADLECVVDGRWSRDMIARWESATGAKWAAAAA